MGVVGQAIEQGRGQFLIAEDSDPFGEGEIARNGGEPRLYEAVAQALRIFREQVWCKEDLRHSAASVMVKIVGLVWGLGPHVFPRRPNRWATTPTSA